MFEVVYMCVCMVYGKLCSGFCSSVLDWATTSPPLAGSQT